MSTMTAAELYAIVKDVPREAWPDGVQAWTKPDNAHVYLPGLQANTADPLALMFEASMTRWLIGRAAKFKRRAFKMPDTGRRRSLEGSHLILTSDDLTMWFAYILPYDDTGSYVDEAAEPDIHTGQASRPSLVAALAAACISLSPKEQA